MTSRIGQPDTEADVRIREILSGDRPANFVMVSGAGSGKTTSLVKALHSLASTRSDLLRRRGQKVACITYTEIAAGEIWSDVGSNPLFHVSTIHSFLWEVSRPFQHDIRLWAARRLQSRIDELHAEQAGLGPRVGQKRRDRIAADIERYEFQATRISTVPSFRYGTGSDYLKGMLGHSDILGLGADLIRNNEAFRTLLAQRFPYVFVDESQDTTPDVVHALKEVTTTAGASFCLGFFGDPMQKIYATGIGGIDVPPEWLQITKPENFRCPTSVLTTINNIRTKGSDPLVQKGGKKLRTADGDVPVVGTSRIFIAPADAQRADRVAQVRDWLSRANDDEAWVRDDAESNVRVLVIAHRMAARRLGFETLYGAFNDQVPDSVSQGFADGSHWGLKPFLSDILPVLEADQNDHDFRVISALRKRSPVLEPSRVRCSDLGTTLDKLQADLAVLGGMLAVDSNATVNDVLRFVMDNETFALDERMSTMLRELGEEEACEEAGEDADGERRALLAFLSVRARELVGYRKYFESQSPFATQQGIKGAEFSRVLVIADDEEGRHFQFSYNKLFGVTPLSTDDLAKQASGQETQLERTRRLFYVCCSRAEKDLAVIFFTNEMDRAAELIRDAGYFSPDDIHVLK